MHTLNTASAILAIFIEALTGDVLPVTIFYTIQYMTFDFSIFRAETLSLDTGHWTLDTGHWTAFAIPCNVPSSQLSATYGTHASKQF